MTSIRRYGWIVIVWGLVGCATPLPDHIESPSVTIANVDVVGLTVFEQRYKLSLRIQNPNAFDLPVRGMAVSMLINGKEIGKGVNNEHFTLPAIGEAVRDIEIVSGIDRLAHALQPPRSNATPAANFYLHGRLVLEDRQRSVAFKVGGAVVDR